MIENYVYKKFTLFFTKEAKEMKKNLFFQLLLLFFAIKFS